MLGGPAAVSDAVLAEVANITGPGITRRVSGGTRDATAAAISDLFCLRDNAAIVEGFAADFWTYALPAGPAAAILGAPLLFTNGGDGSLGATEAVLREFPPLQLVVFGPESRVSAATQAAAEDAAFGP